MNSKPKLIPVDAAWQISPSTPQLRFSAAEMESPTVVTASCNFLSDGGELQRIEICFGRALHARVSPSFSDSEVLPEDDYDWSAVPQYGFEQAARDEFAATWRRTGRCPDPGMYEVDASPWLAQATSRRKLKHFIVLGHDIYIEVLAESWSWLAQESQT